MRYLRHACAVLMVASLSTAARADEDAEKPADRPPAAEREGRPDREAMRQRMMERFDADKDGKLSDDEREKMREFRREQFGQRGDRGPREGRGPEAGEGRGRGPEGRRPEGRGAEARRPDRPGPGGPPEDRRGAGRGPEGRGPGGPGRGPRGPEGPGPGPGFRPMGPPPVPAELFKQFDADKNDQLSVEEFEKLMGHLRDRMAGPPRGFRGPGGPGGPGPGARPEGRPPRGEGEGRPDRRRQRPANDGAADESKADEEPAEDETA